MFSLRENNKPRIDNIMETLLSVYANTEFEGNQTCFIYRGKSFRLLNCFYMTLFSNCLFRKMKRGQQTFD